MSAGRHPAPGREEIRAWTAACVGFGLPFLAVFYLACETGGYDLIDRGWVGMLAWAIVLAGALGGALPVSRLTSRGKALLALIAAFTLWNALATVGWTESAERSLVETTRSLGLLGILALLMLAQGRDGLRRSLSGLGTAVALVAGIALLSRFSPDLFSVPELPPNYPDRLSFPVGYWNGLAALLAIGAPALVWLATASRRPEARAASAAAVPVVVAAGYLTASRGGAIAAAAGLVTLVALHPYRLSLVPTLALTGLGSALLIWQLDARPELRDGGLGEVAGPQGTEMIWLTLALCLVVAAAQYGGARFLESRPELRPRAGRRAAARFAIGVAAVAVVALVAALASGFAGDRWEEFKQPAEREGTVARLASVSSGERYESWRSALDAGGQHPVLGIGPGTFEFWWTEHGEGRGYVRDAHSLYFESFAELGLVGLALIVAALALVLAVGGSRALGQGSTSRRSQLAAATAGMVAFVVAAGVEWAWEIAVLPAAAMVLSAAILGPSAESRRGRRSSRFERRPLEWPARAGVSLGAAGAIVLIALPVAGEGLVRSSQEAYRDGDLEAALGDASGALSVQPYSATAMIQRSQVLTALGAADEALEQAEEATRQEPGNWRAWWVLAGAAADSGETALARRARAEVRRLNPDSLLFVPPAVLRAAAQPGSP